MSRWPALQGKRDKNEPEIIEALINAGATVEQIPTGRGVCDLLVGVTSIDDLWCTVRTNYLMEVKTLTGKLNDKQVEWHGRWKGQKCVVRTPAEALAVIGLCYDVDCGRWGGDIDCRCRKAGL